MRDSIDNVRNIIIAIVIFILLFFVMLGWYWSQEPDLPKLHVKQNTDYYVGTATTKALIKTANTLLDKPGGYLRNDLLLPTSWPFFGVDNMPNWEYGVLTQVRDLVKIMRNDFSRSQSQSKEDNDLKDAEAYFNIDDKAFLFPQAEKEYANGIESLENYLSRITDEDITNAQFYARADNLNYWLSVVEKRLGSLSQRLSASVGQERINTDLAGDSSAAQSTQTDEKMIVKTSRTEVDDVFYEARGTAWALALLLYGIQYDFAGVLENKNATISLRQIIRELESTQTSIWSPFILNGSGFGIFANHSLVMASYLSRANAAVIDLRNLLVQG